jgi:Ni,Fe-hydrogenase III small subunit
MLKTLRKICQVGTVTEAPPATDDLLRVRAALDERIRSLLGRALCIRHVDPGSCNGCELEIQALHNPIYNLEGLGIRFVASPRHADLLLVTGPVAANMEAALRRVYDATPDPKLVVAIGDCGCSGGIFGERGARDAADFPCRGRVAGVIPVDVAVPGCPPSPARIMQGILTALAGGLQRTVDREPGAGTMTRRAP